MGLYNPPIPGADGTNGIDGTNGTNGTNGIDGINGTSGGAVVGQVVEAAPGAFTAPDYLPLDGSVLLRSAYPALSAVLAEDAYTDTVRTLGTQVSHAYNHSCYGNGTFVIGASATGSVGAYSADDGTTWQNITSSTGIALGPMAYGNGLYVALHPTFGFVSRSTDGIDWNTYTASAVLGYNWSAVAYGNGCFVACAQNAAVISRSVDGVTWDSQANSGFSSTWCDVQYGAGKFVIIDGNTSACTVRTSADGITWVDTQLHDNIGYGVQALAWNGTVFCAVYGGGNTDYAIVSTDGLDWEPIKMPSKRPWKSIVAVGSTLIATSYQNSEWLKSSLAFSYDNGNTWEEYLTTNGSYPGRSCGSSSAAVFTNQLAGTTALVVAPDATKMRLPVSKSARWYRQIKVQ